MRGGGSISIVRRTAPKFLTRSCFLKIMIGEEQVPTGGDSGNAEKGRVVALPSKMKKPRSEGRSGDGSLNSSVQHLGKILSKIGCSATAEANGAEMRINGPAENLDTAEKYVRLFCAERMMPKDVDFARRGSMGARTGRHESSRR